MRPVYDFISFYLTEIRYSRAENNIPLITEIKASIVNKDKEIFTLDTKVKITFSNNDTGLLTFSSTYRINDISWASALGDSSLTSVLFSAVFPFVREKIFNLTQDSNEPIMLPIIDLKNSNIETGIKFERRVRK